MTDPQVKGNNIRKVCECGKAWNFRFGSEKEKEKILYMLRPGWECESCKLTERRKNDDRT